MKKKRKKFTSVDDLIKGAKEWDQKYLDVTVHALDYCDPDHCYELVQKFLSRKAQAEFRMTNPHSKRLWLASLLQAFLAIQPKKRLSWDQALRESKVACAMVTFTHEEWACADENIQFNLKRAKQKVRNALAGTDFVACFEAAIYKNEKWTTDGKTGKLISFHCHAIAWSGSRSCLRRLQAKIQKRFEPILGNKNGVRMDEIETMGDAATALRYIAKFPVEGKRTVPGPNGKLQRKSAVTLRSRWHLFKEMQKHDTFAFWLGGGQGAYALRTARRAVKAKHKPPETYRGRPLYYA